MHLQPRGRRNMGHFKACPLYRGLDTLTDWNPTHTIAQHAGWLTQSPATQQLTTVLKQTEVLEAVRRGLVPTAVYTLLRTHAEDPQATAAHMQRTAVAKMAERSHTAPTNTCSMRQPCPQRTKPTSSNSCSTNPENLLRDIPTRNPHHVYTPSTEHSTGTAHTDTTGTAHTPTSMRAPPAPIPPRRRPSTGTTNRQPAHVPSAFASGYHRQPCPATQTTGSAWEPRTASPTAPTAGTSTPTTASGPRPQPHPPPRATPASSGSSPTLSGTTWEGTTWRTRRTTHGP